MSGGLPFGWELCAEQNIGANTARTFGASLTANATTLNVPGAWTSIGTTVQDAVFVEFELGTYNNATPLLATMVSIALGATGSAANTIAQLYIPGANGQQSACQHIFCPLVIPGGTQIWAALQGSNTSSVADISMRLLDGAVTQMEGCGGIDIIGFNSATTLSTNCVPGGAELKGAWSQLIASSARDYQGFFFAVDYQNIQTPTQTSYYIDIGLGAAASENTVISNWYTSSGGFSGVAGFFPPASIYYPIQIPAGTRIAARVQAHSGTLSNVGVVLHGVYQ
jgi:hypothetical protein